MSQKKNKFYKRIFIHIDMMKFENDKKRTVKAAYAIYDQVSTQFKHNIETSIMDVCITKVGIFEQYQFICCYDTF